MDKIGFVVVRKTDHPDEIYANKEYSVGKNCSKIIAFSADGTKAILQVWKEDAAEVKERHYKNPKTIPGKFKKVKKNRNHIEGKPVDLYDRIPSKFRMAKNRIPKG